MIDFKDRYGKLLEKVEQKIADTARTREPRSLYEPFEYIMSGGGKRIRPVLAMMVSGAVSGDPDKALNSAVAVEILHNFTLVHDDIMDSSPVRRGKQTVHVKWNIPTGIILGDVMVGHAYNLLPTPSAHDKSEQIHREFTRALIEVCDGQAYDTEFDEKDGVTLDDYMMMIDKKTAKLLEGAAVIGAYAGSATDAEVDAVRDYAHNLGIAFQIQDDLLDITADQAEFGKRIGQDIIEGKKTFLILSLKNKTLEPADQALLDKFFAEHGAGADTVADFKAMFEKYDIFKNARATADDYFEKAEKALSGLKPGEWTDMLGELLKSLNKRKY